MNPRIQNRNLHHPEKSRHFKRFRVSVAGIARAPYGRAMEDAIDPTACKTMAEVRAGVDAVDRALIALLARRFGYMEAAARIKPERGLVRDEARKAAVIANAKAHAREAGIPEKPIGELWERLVEASIAYELEAFDRIRV